MPTKRDPETTKGRMLLAVVGMGQLDRGANARGTCPPATVSATRPVDDRGIPLWRRSRWIGRVMALAGGLVVLLLVVRAGPIAVLYAVQRVGAGFVLVLLAPTVGMVLHCLGWLVLLPRAARPTLWVGLSAHVAAQAGDELGAGVAGEPLKVLVLARGWRAQAAAAVALDNVAQLVALGGFMIGAASIALLYPPTAGSRAGAPLILVGILLVVGAVALPLLMVAGLHRSPQLRRYRSVAWLVGTLDVARDTMRTRRMLASVLLHGLGKTWIVPEIALTLALMGSRPVAALWLAPMSVLGSLLGTAIPGQAGTVEAALAAGGAMVGLDPATVMALALLRRARTIGWVIAGILLVRKVIRYGRHAKWHYPAA